MRFAELFERATGPLISFEVFPPRTDKAAESFERTLPRLAALKPSYMTVTYGAMGSTQDRTAEIAGRIRRDFGLLTACHLTCVGSTIDEIDTVLDSIRGLGIENIVALRGDPPRGESEFVAPEGGFSHANELVAHIRGREQFGIAVAGYPEKHIEAPDLETDLRHLEQKVRAGGDVVITQLFYDNADFYAFERRARELGVSVPLVPGLMPIQSYGQIQKVAGMCGASIPPALREELEAAADDKDRVRQIGVEWTAAQARELLERGTPGIHFYVLNRARQMEEIMKKLGTVT